MPLLTNADFELTMAAGMGPITEDQDLPDGFWDYFDDVPDHDLGDHDFDDADIADAFADRTGRWHHVLVDGATPNVYLVIVIDVAKETIHGHHLVELDLSIEPSH